MAILVSFSFREQKGSFKTVADLEIKAYLGLWYEIARIPNDFQDFNKATPCTNTTAQYELAPLGYIKVTNRCDYYNELKAATKSVATATAFVFDADNFNSKLKVNFVPYLQHVPVLNHLFAGDYWVLALGPKNSEGLYTWSVVVSPDFKSQSSIPEAKYAWILARDRNFAKSTEYQQTLQVLRAQKIDTSLLK